MRRSDSGRRRREATAISPIGIGPIVIGPIVISPIVIGLTVIALVMVLSCLGTLPSTLRKTSNQNLTNPSGVM